MSTAATGIGCLAEDYQGELADICEAFLAQLPPAGVALPERALRARDVAQSMVMEIKGRASSVVVP